MTKPLQPKRATSRDPQLSLQNRAILAIEAVLNEWERLGMPGECRDELEALREICTAIRHGANAKNFTGEIGRA